MTDSRKTRSTGPVPTTNAMDSHGFVNLDSNEVARRFFEVRHVGQPQFPGNDDGGDERWHVWSCRRPRERFLAVKQHEFDLPQVVEVISVERSGKGKLQCTSRLNRRGTFILQEGDSPFYLEFKEGEDAFLRHYQQWEEKQYLQQMYSRHFPPEPQPQAAKQGRPATLKPKKISKPATPAQPKPLSHLSIKQEGFTGEWGWVEGMEGWWWQGRMGKKTGRVYKTYHGPAGSMRRA